MFNAGVELMKSPLGLVYGRVEAKNPRALFAPTPSDLRQHFADQVKGETAEATNIRNANTRKRKEKNNTQQPVSLQ